MCSILYRGASAILVAMLAALALAGCSDPETRKQKAYEKGVAFLDAGEYRKAMLEFRNAIQVDPEFTDARYGLGQSLLKQGSYPGAVTELKKVRDARPDLIELRPYLAEALVGAGDFEEGATLCGELAAENPDNAAMHDFLSRALIGISDQKRSDSSEDASIEALALVKNAMDSAAKALSLDPKLVEPHMTLARALIAERRYAVPIVPLSETDKVQIRAHFAQAKENSPNNVPLLRRMAGLWSWAGDQTEALTETEAALAVSPQDGDARLLKAELLFDAGKADEAQAIAAKLIEDKLAGQRIDLLMGRIWLGKNELEKAREEFRKVKNSPAGGYYFGFCLQRLGDRQQAIGQYVQVLDQMPSHEAARRALFESYMQDGNLDRALVQAEEAVKAVPSSPLGYLLRARVYGARQDWQRAHDSIDEALRHDMSSPEALLVRADLYRDEGNQDAWLAAVNVLVERYPTVPTGYLVRSEARLRAGRFDEAEADAVKASELAPDDPRPRVAIARARIARSDLDGAAAAYGAACDMAPEDTSIRLAYAGLCAARKEYQKGIDLLKTVPENDALYVLARKRIGEIYEAMGDTAAADAEFKNLAATHPDAVDATTGLFQHLWRAEEFAEVEQLAKATIDRDPASPLGHLMLSDLYSAQRAWSRAADEMKAAVKLQPDSSRLLFRLGTLSVSANRLEEALDAFKRAGQLQPGLDAATLGAAKTLAQLGRAPEGVQLCDGILQKDPNNANALLALGDIKLVQGDKPEAESLYRKVIATDPRLVLPYARLASLYERDKKIDEARNVYKEALAASPNIAGLYVEYGQFCERQNEQALAREQYQRALELVPGDPQIEAMLTRNSAETGDYEAAEKQLRARIAQEPADLYARLNLALVLEKQDKKEEATRSLLDFVTASEDPEAAGMALSRIFASRRQYDDVENLADNLLAADSTNWMAHYVLGIADAGRGETESARVHFAEASECKKDIPFAKHAEGLMAAQLDKSAEALGAFEAALKIDPKFMPAFIDAILLQLRSKDFEKAETLCRRALEVEPNAPRPIILLAVTFARSGRYQEAVDEAGKLLARDSEQALPVSMVANSLSLDGQHDAAIALGKRCLAIAPDNPALIMRMAGLYQRADKLDIAESEYRRLVRLAPNYAAGYNNLAWVLCEQDKVDEALTYAQRARDLMPTHPAFLDTLGWVYFKKGNLKEAIPLLESSAKGAPQDPEVLFHLANAYVKDGRNDQARPLLESALKLDQGFKGAENARAMLADMTK